MAPRKDIHRPAMIEPADYQFVAFDYLPSSPGDIGQAMFMQEERKRKRAHMDKSGGSYSQHEHGGLCHICGSVNAIYSASFYHAKSNSYIKAGLDCAQKLECSGIDAFKKNVKKAKEAAAGKRKAAAILNESGFAKAWELFEAHGAQHKVFAAAHKEWRDAGDEEAAEPKYPESSKDESIVLDMVGKVVKWGNPPSEAAGKFMLVLLDRIERAPEIAAEKAAAKALEMANAKPVPMVEGRVLVKGEVLSVKQQEGFYGIQIKMLVKSEAGFKLWGSCPAAIVGEVEKGSVVEFNASIKASDDDKFFGFFSRPAKARLIKAAA